MAFPTTSVLDTFDRADSLSLGSAWSSALGVSRWGISFNTAYNGGNVNVADYWNGSTFGDCEIGTLLNFTGFTNSDYFEVLARIANPGAGTLDCYAFRWTRATVASNSTWKLYRYDNAVATLLSTGANSDWLPGDSMGLECNGSTITGYNNAGGVWSAVTSTTDATYSAAGYVGINAHSSPSDFNIDDLFGGTIISGGPPPPPPEVIAPKAEFDECLDIGSWFG